MAQIPLGIGAYSRPYGKLPEIRMENRFFEQNPVGAEKVALLSRPGSSLFLDIGDGPIRAMFSQAGVFDEDLFIVSGEEFFRYDGTTETPITGSVLGTPSYPVMTSIAIPEWEAIFITDGVTLQYYEGESRSFSELIATFIATGEQVRIDDTYYEFADPADLETGPPDGTSGTPWLVAIDVDDNAITVENLFNAINLLGNPGTDYSLGTLIHPSVRAFGLTEDSFQVRANIAGAAGDAIVTTETGATMAWTGATLAGGGGHELKLCTVPDGVIFTDLASLASHVIAAEANSRRFFWIRPGEVEVDALDFSSAEAEPDNIVNIATVGDQLWIFGQSSTESWYASGDADQPFLRTQGRAFSQGIIPGTFAKIQETIIVVGQDRVAYRIAGVPQRISHHGIEEKIRLWQESLP